MDVGARGAWMWGEPEPFPWTHGQEVVEEWLPDWSRRCGSSLKFADDGRYAACPSYWIQELAGCERSVRSVSVGLLVGTVGHFLSMAGWLP